MGNEAGEWITYGLDWDNPKCLHTMKNRLCHEKRILERMGLYNIWGIIAMIFTLINILLHMTEKK
jgi:hypothetical protein